MIDILPAPGTVHTLTEVQERIALVAPYTSWVHIDIADMTLVQNETFHDFSHWKEQVSQNLSYEAHLMVATPEKYIRPLVNAGFKRLIAHIECEDPRRFLEEAEFEEVEVGLALDGPSPIEDIEPFLQEIDVALIMGIEAGFSGQKFMLETLEKLKSLQHHYPEVLLQVDGGIDEKSGPACIEAGAKRLAVTSFLFKNPSNIPENLAFLANSG